MEKVIAPKNAKKAGTARRTARSIILKEHPKFKLALKTLSEHEELLLTASMLKNGCIEPITTWKGHIVDGHHRYRICTKYDIRFKTVNLDEKEYPRADDVLSFIMKKQAGRRQEGQMFVAWQVGSHFLELRDQKKKKGNIDTDSPSLVKSVAEEYGYSESTIKRYANFAEAVNLVSKQLGTSQTRILLDNRLNLSMDRVSKLREHTDEASLKKAYDLLIDGDKPTHTPNEGSLKLGPSDVIAKKVVVQFVDQLLSGPVEDIKPKLLAFLETLK